MFYTAFFDANPKYYGNTVEEFTSASKNDLLAHMIEYYLTSIKDNNHLNVEKQI
jgi:hypothetical protein